MEKGTKDSNTQKPNREASVQVHVYNQTQNEQEQFRGLFRIKERMPSSESPDLPSEDRRRSIPAATGIPETCSGCGCHSPSSKEPHDQSYREEPKCEEEEESNDDIQIPVISSSTENLSNISSPPSSSSEDSLIKRRTRSCSSSLSAESKEQTKLKQKRGTSTRQASGGGGGSCNDSSAVTRSVLKSVNRGEPKVVHSQKRKRTREILKSGEDRSTKSLRIHTRSRSLSRKSMITRSQDKGAKLRIK